MYCYPWGREGDETDYSDPQFNPSLGESLEFVSGHGEFENLQQRLDRFRDFIERGGGTMAIGGHLVLVVSPEPPPNKTHVVYVPLDKATPELLLDATDNAQRLELKAIKR